MHITLLRGFLLVVTIALTATAKADRDYYYADKYDEFSLDDFDTVDDAVAAITERLEDQGFNIVGVVNHAAAAASVDLELGPTQVVLFSAPRREAVLVRQRQSIGIDLPQKILVYANDDGELELKYNAPGYLLDRHEFDVRGRRRSIGRTLSQFGDVDDGLLAIDSEQSVEDTVAKLEEVLAAAGFRIPFVIDFDAAAGRSGKRGARSVVIIFGNPRVGTQLMVNSREVALDLPQKFLVARNRRGQVTITWNDPFFVAQRGGVQGLDTLLGNISNALRNFATQGAIP